MKRVPSKPKKPYDTPRILHRSERHLWNSRVRRLYLCFADGAVGPLSTSADAGRRMLEKITAPDDIRKMERNIIADAEKRTGVPYERTTTIGTPIKRTAGMRVKRKSLSLEERVARQREKDKIKKRRQRANQKVA